MNAKYKQCRIAGIMIHDGLVLATPFMLSDLLTTMYPKVENDLTNSWVFYLLREKEKIYYQSNQ